MAGGHPRCRLRMRSTGCDRLCRAPATRGRVRRDGVRASHLVAGAERRHCGRMKAPSIPTTGHAQPRAAVLLQRFSSRPAWRHLARRLLPHQLDAWGVPHGSEASDTATLLVAELAANAAPHGRVLAGTSRLTLRSSAGSCFSRVAQALCADPAEGEERCVVGAGRPGGLRGGRRRPGVPAWPASRKQRCAATRRRRVSWSGSDRRRSVRAVRAHQDEVTDLLRRRDGGAGHAGAGRPERARVRRRGSVAGWRDQSAPGRGEVSRAGPPRYGTPSRPTRWHASTSPSTPRGSGSS
jgi:hypothetical protein